MSQIFTVIDPTGTAGSVLWVQTADNNAALRSRFSGAAAPASPAPIAGQQFYPTAAGGIVSDYNGAGWDGVYLKGVRTDDNEAYVRLGAIAATGNRYIYVAKRNVTIVTCKMVSDVTTVSTGVNHWTIMARNLTAALDLRSAAFDTDGNDFTADVVKDLGLNANLNIAAGDVIELQLAKFAAATDFVETMVILDALPR